MECLEVIKIKRNNSVALTLTEQPLLKSDTGKLSQVGKFDLTQHPKAIFSGSKHYPFSELSLLRVELWQ